ncbi:hypothetical protein PUN28_020850 [Cardiocondyla obscurior]|uniref:RING-type domain-containing protein n=1 Tax=Cardiocondyla obscurior TaxID=286306 RepID=A0AAW2E5B2_9HYME
MQPARLYTVINTVLTIKTLGENCQRRHIGHQDVLYCVVCCDTIVRDTFGAADCGHIFCNICALKCEGPSQNGNILTVVFTFNAFVVFFTFLLFFTFLMFFTLLLFVFFRLLIFCFYAYNVLYQFFSVVYFLL